MGEDIHQRVFVKSKKTGNYLNAHDICSWNPEYSIFKELVSGRNYDTFSLFGSSRGNYKELSYANYGIPDFLRDSIFDDYCKEYGYYGFIWFRFPDLVKAVDEYIEKLYDPLKYLDNDSDDYLDWFDFVEQCKSKPDGYEQLIKSYREWLDEHSSIISSLKNIKHYLSSFIETTEYDSTYKKLIDIDETIFLFFFDN